MSVKFKVLIVDDSAFMRKLIKNVIITDPMFEIVGVARNGKETIEQLAKWKPDVITMDVQMPEMDGLQTLAWIMREHPMPVIMLSSVTQSGAKETIRALELGAFDFVAKPAMTIAYSLKDLSDELLGKMHAAVQSKSFRKRTVQTTQTPQPPQTPQSKSVRPVSWPPSSVESTQLQPDSLPVRPDKKPVTGQSITQIIAIGTSTGGPAALNQVLSQLPSGLAAPVLVVQHMPANFTRSLADRLNTISGLRVKEAEDGDLLQNGHAYVAPGGYQMTVQRAGKTYKIKIDQSPPVSGHRPSVNKLFDSLVGYRELKRHVVLMTGMGSDGAEGMRRLLDSGATTTIAESDKTCVVYGMPKAAVQLQAAQHQIPLHEIAKKLIEVVKQVHDESI